MPLLATAIDPAAATGIDGTAAQVHRASETHGITGSSVTGLTGSLASESVTSTKKQDRPGAPIMDSVQPGNHELIVSLNLAGTGAPPTSLTARCGRHSVTVDSGDPGEITVPGLTNDKTYSCVGFASDATKRSPKSRRLSGTPQEVVPGTPSIGNVSPGDGSLTVAYGAAAGFGSTVNSYTATCGSASTTVAGSVLSATVSGLSVGANYDCTLYATDAAGNGPSADWSGNAGPPGEPTITSVLSEDGQLTVLFRPVYYDATAYTATCGDQSVSVNGGIEGGGDAGFLWATVTGLSDGDSYPCTVSATNTAGQGPASAPLSGTPDPIAASPTPSAGGFFVAVDCPSTSVCVAVGDGNGSGLVELSSDGGKSFTDVPVPAGTPELRAVTCSDTSHCVAVGGSTALVSTDGGLSWSLVYAGLNLSAVSCLSEDICVAGAGNYGADPVVSSEGGSTWQVSTNSNPLIDISCTSTTCFGLGPESPYVYSTQDEGTTWQATVLSNYLNEDDASPSSVACLPATTSCIAVTQRLLGSGPAPAFMTNDDGSTWTDISPAFPPGSSTMIAISCPTATTCYTLGGPVSLTTTDAGTSWTSVAGPDGPLSPSGKGIIAGSQTLSCSSASTCVVVGYDSSGPAAASTSDGATTWTQATIG